MPSPAASVSTHEITRQTAQGTFWAYLSFASGKALTFISTVILARLLSPEEFGLVGYCTIAFQYLDILNGFGLESALISFRGDLQPAANLTFGLGLITSAVFFAAAWWLAPWVAVFFNEPLVVPLFRLLGLTLFLSNLAIVPSALIRRRMRFKEKLIPDVARSLAKGLFSIVFALGGLGVWSLVWGQIAGELVSVVVFWGMARWRPTLEFNWGALRTLLGFGGHMIIVDVGGALRNNVDYLLVGRILGAAPLGLYTQAYRIPELLIRSLNVVVGNVGHPALAQLQATPQQMRVVYFGYLRYIALLTLPAGVGLAVLADLFIRTFYTDQWLLAIPVMQLVSLAIAIGTIGYVPGILFKAVNRPDILNVLALVKLPVFVIALWYATQWGIVGVAAMQIAAAIFYSAIDSLAACLVMRFPLSDIFRAVGPASIASLLMGGGLLALRLTWPLEGIIGMSLLVLAGVLAYGLALAVFDRSTVAELFTYARAAVPGLPWGPRRYPPAPSPTSHADRPSD